MQLVTMCNIRQTSYDVIVFLTSVLLDVVHDVLLTSSL